MNNTAPSSPPEFSHTVAVEKIPAAGLVKTLEASADERRRLAARFGLVDLSSLRAELAVNSARAGQAIEVKGRMTADVVQKCVVTAEPLPAHIEHEIEALYTSAQPEEEEVGAQLFVDPSEVEVEPIRNGVIDLGELVAQNLGVALDPYPRKPGTVFEDAVYGTEPALSGPFAKLVELRKKAEE